jgi:hypothetical protein
MGGWAESFNVEVYQKMSPPITTKLPDLLNRAGFPSLLKFSQKVGLTPRLLSEYSRERNPSLETYFAMSDAIAEGMNVSQKEAMWLLREALQ